MQLDHNVENKDSAILSDAEDTTGFAEIQEALAELKKLETEDPENQEGSKKDTTQAEQKEQYIAKEELPEKKEEANEEQGGDAEEDDVTAELIPNKEKKREKVWQIKRAKFRALAEKEQALKRVAELEGLLEQSLNTGAYHYTRSAEADLEKAKIDKRKAIEEGDIDSMLESDIAIAQAISTINDIKKWDYSSAKEQPREEYIQEQAQQQGLTPMQRELASDWIEEHEYLQADSPKYNQKLANQVVDFIGKLDNSLVNNNQMGSYFSEEYFDTIEQYIEKITTPPKQPIKNLASIAPVGGVTNSHTGSARSSVPIQISLTAREKAWCAEMGVNEKDWLKHKLVELNKGK